MSVTSKRCAVLIFTILSLLSLTLLSGCQYAYPVELRGVVRSAADGAPIAGVTVMLSPDGAYGSGYARVFPATSAQDGMFRVSFTMPDIAFGGPWSVSLKMEGYQDETIDLGPFNEPKSSDPDPLRIVVAASMRPGEPADTQALKRIGGKVRWAGMGPGDPAVGISLVDGDVTDFSLSSLKGVPTLRQLTLEGPNLTDAMLSQLVSLTKLQTLELVGTDHVTDTGIENLRRALPQLKIRRR